MLFRDLDSLGSHIRWQPEYGRVTSSLGNLPGRITMLSDAGCLLGEAFLISPKLSFPITDPNHGTIRLLNRAFGPQLLDRLFSEGAIEFLHGEQEYSSPENADKYNAILRDVEQCISNGLMGENGLSTQDMKMLSRQATRNTIICENGDVSKFVAGHDIDYFEHIDHRKTIEQLEHDGISAHGVNKTVEIIMTQENIPSIRHLLNQKQLTIRQAAELRSHRSAEEFRKWLWNRPDPANSAQVLKEYQRIILEQTSAPDQPVVMRAVRITGVSLTGSAVGTTVGMAMAGPPGMIIGAAVGLAISLLDGFSDKIVRQANPRLFATILHDQVVVNEIVENGKKDRSGAKK
jgi:hypothetical protein